MGAKDRRHAEHESELAGLRATRRAFLGGAAAAVAGGALLEPRIARAGTSPGATGLAATPPAGFVPVAAPGRIAKVTKKGCLEANGVYPKPDDAKEMLRRALEVLTGKSDLVHAAALFVHPDDVVCVKVNGIAGPNMSTCKELVVPFMEAMAAVGVKPENMTVLEVFGSWFTGCRINEKNVPRGAKISIHNKTDATMPYRTIPGTGVQTKFVRALTEATALINFALIKDHSICGYTGCLKNITHGASINPQDFHSHHASPQIALMAAQDIVTSRLRLNITDGFKVMAHGGPTWKQPQYVVPHEAVYATTDPVAMDAIGWDIVEKERATLGLRTLTDEGRMPAYIRAAADLGLGVFDRNAIQLHDVVI
jgi:uncharacterized protein (DUF362 family)